MKRTLEKKGSKHPPKAKEARNPTGGLRRADRYNRSENDTIPAGEENDWSELEHKWRANILPENND